MRDLGGALENGRAMLGSWAVLVSNFSFVCHRWGSAPDRGKREGCLRRTIFPSGGARLSPTVEKGAECPSCSVWVSHHTNFSVNQLVAV